MNPQNLGWLAAFAILVSLSWSPAVGSIGMGLLLAAGLWQYTQTGWKAGLGSHPLVWISLAIYLLSLAAWFTTSDQALWLTDLRQKLWYLLIPTVFAALPPFSFRQIKTIFIGMLAANSLVALGTLVNYLLHFEAIQEGIAEQRSVPVMGGFSHIYFSIILAVCILAAVWLIVEKNALLKTWERNVIAGCGVFLFIALHIFVSRTGYLALYTGLLAFFFFRALAHRQWKVFGVTTLLVILIPVASYFLIPSFQLRMNVTFYDIARYSQQDQNLDWQSVSRRFIAMQAAWQIYLDNPVFGTGIADMEAELLRVSEDMTDRVTPENLLENTHNQFLEFMGGFGTIGLLLLVALLATPFYRFDPKTGIFLHSLVFLLIAAAMFESILERQAGLSMVLLLLFILKGSKEKLA